MVPGILKPLRAGFLHHIDLMQLFSKYGWSEGKKKLPQQAVSTPSGKNHHLEQRLNDPSFLSAFLQQRKWEGGGEAFAFQQSITVLLPWSLATVKPWRGCSKQTFHFQAFLTLFKDTASYSIEHLSYLIKCRKECSQGNRKLYVH